MSERTERVAVRFSGVGKMYKIFPTRFSSLLDTLGLARLMPWRRPTHQEFWAVRGVDLEIKKGNRLGIIGRNGAGKTTLLKLLTGNLVPTEGELEITGKVQPLLDLGAGFHPEFTGYENVRASLTYQGLSPAEIKAAEADIADFTELGEFLERPFKTYSLGMQARLAFATATTLKPEILIIDEILGAGDAYFLGKSTERMRTLVESGASVIIVSHALDYITRFCEDAIWMDRGRIISQGNSLEVVKAYQQFIQVLDDRRLKAKNRKLRVGSYSSGAHSESSVEHLVVRLLLRGGRGASCDVDGLTIWKNEEVEELLEIGRAQDAAPGHGAFVLLEDNDWSAPRKTDRGLCRRLECNDLADATRVGSIWLNLYLLDAEYSLEVSYRCHGPGRLSLEVLKNGVVYETLELPSGGGDWTFHRFLLKGLEDDRSSPYASSYPGTGSAATAVGGPARGVVGDSATRATRRWPGEGSLTIEEVFLLGPDGREQAVFQVGTPMTMRVTLVAHRDGTLEVLPAAVLYRLDGILVSNHVGKSASLQLKAGERREARLDFGPLNLGNGHYVFSVALYRRLSASDDAEWYDLIAHSYEFQVIGNGPFENGIFRHPGEWRFLMHAEDR